MTNDEPDAIVSYTQEDAVNDGILKYIFQNRWKQLSGGKPILATTHLADEVSEAALIEIWNEFQRKLGHLPAQQRMEQTPFVTKMNMKKVWVMEDPSAFTLMYPEDY